MYVNQARNIICAPTWSLSSLRLRGNAEKCYAPTYLSLFYLSIARRELVPTIEIIEPATIRVVYVYIVTFIKALRGVFDV